MIKFCDTVPVSAGLQDVVKTNVESPGSNVVVTVWIESQPKRLMNCSDTTPVSAGLQDVKLSNVESDGENVVVIVCTESQPN